MCIQRSNISFFLKLTDITAEEFVTRPKIGAGTNAYGKSKYELLRAKIAGLLNVVEDNVDIFTVRNVPPNFNVVDIRYSAHGSPYYRPARMDGLVNQHKDEVFINCCHNFYLL